MAISKQNTFTYKDISDRKRKNIAILDYVRRKGPVSRTDISKESGINIVSVSNYIMSYLKKSLVLECGLDISTGGRRPELVKLNLESAYVVGLDIGPERLIAVVTNLSLKTKAKVALPRPKGSMDQVLSGSVSALDRLFKELNVPPENIKLIGVGASGVIDISSGTIHDTDPLRGRTRSNFYTLASLIEEKFNIPTLIGNDATCAAFGEISLSPRSDITEMLYMYSDIGCGIIINGDIYCGASGSAGEIQLLVENKEKMKTGSEIASYGVRGADLGIVDKAKKLVDEKKDTKILELAGGKKEKITKKIIIDAAQKGDKLAKEILMDAASWLGIKVAYMINMFNPQLVTIGGGMEEAGSLFLDALTNCVKMYAFEEAFNAVKIMPTFLKEDAVALGAAALGVRELFLNA